MALYHLPILHRIAPGRETFLALELKNLEIRRRRALWRAGHRGMKELDLMLGGYAKAQLAGMSEPELAEFEALMDLPEPVLYGWLVAGEAPPDTAPLALIAAIRQGSFRFDA